MPIAALDPHCPPRLLALASRPQQGGCDLDTDLSDPSVFAGW